jgi:hypothetical protein
LASQLRLVSPLQLGTKVGPGSARWLDVPTERLGPTDNTRFRLLEAGVPAYSCPLRVLHRIILATWWIRASCACPERPWVDLLVVLRSGRYRVFGLS